ncbi:MAG TPA: NADH-quinone oxidoreductase subunit NuoK [Bacteroidales bacterium]|nr:NADH-quinone oxidoreductase subunit NuoK [Bacteroidales bacterium]HSA44688.1 NADH-quinone oxidoreductase subunit NuoK [Bacteroidales bacterium]
MLYGIRLEYFLILATLMFFVGIYGFLTRRNLITMLMSVELILNAVNIQFVAFNRYLFPDKLEGHFFSLIVVAVAAAEAAVAIAIIINIYRHFTSINVEDVDEMKY